jgi:hypothetical protein
MQVRMALAMAALVLLTAAPTRLSAEDKDSGTTDSTAKDGAAKEGVTKDGDKEEFRAARREIQARLRKKQPFERIAALRDLHTYPTVDAAKLLVTVGLRDDTAEVRSAAFDTLLDFKDNSEIARYLVITLY